MPQSIPAFPETGGKEDERELDSMEIRGEEQEQRIPWCI